MKRELTLNGNIIHVKYKHDTLFWGREESHYYYDIDNWLVSYKGKEGESPSQRMSEGLKSYVKETYYPLVGLSLT